MHYKKIILLGLIASSSYLFADKYDDMKIIENKAFENSQEIDLSVVSKNLEKNDFQNNLSEIYKQAKKNVDIETKNLIGESDESVENMNSLKTEKTKKIQAVDYQKFLQKNRIYIFMSESVPLDIWHTYGKFMHDKKLYNSNMVLRGCLGGNCEKIKPTADFIVSLKQYDKNNEINPNVIIDPLLFRKYEISKVPCIVFAEDVQTKDLGISEAKDENFNSKTIYKSCGDWNLTYHLKNIQKQSGSLELEQIIDYLEEKND